MLNILSAPQKTLPASAVGVLLTAAGSAWGNPASFTELTASMASDAVLSGIVVRPTFGFFFEAFDVEIDIATGAAASEVVIATFRWGAFNPPGQANPGNVIYALPIGIDNIASGDRVSARMRISTTSVFTCRVSATYYEKPISGTYLTTPNPQVVIPAASNSIVLTAGSSWGSGSYQELRTNSGSAVILISLIAYGGSNNAIYHEVDIATGAAASEVVITTVAIHNETTGTTPAWILFTLPLDNVAASTRIAARSRSNFNGATIRVALNVIEKPLLVGSAFTSFGTGV